MAGRGLGPKFQGMNWIWGPSRFAIYFRDRDPITGQPRCLWCGSRVWIWNNKGRRRGCLDHLKPVTLGGTNHHRNLVSSCLSCNLERRDQDWEDWCGGSNFDPDIYDRIVTRIRRELTDDEREAGRTLWRARKRGPRCWWDFRLHPTGERPEGAVEGREPMVAEAEQKLPWEI